MTEVRDVLMPVEEQHPLGREASIETMCGLIREYVEPDGRNANGGSIAKLMVVGTRIFVRAPARHLAEIERWPHSPGQLRSAQGFL